MKMELMTLTGEHPQLNLDQAGLTPAQLLPCLPHDVHLMVARQAMLHLVPGPARGKHPVQIALRLPHHLQGGPSMR